MKKAVFRALLKIARAVLEQVIAQVTSQVNRVEEEVTQVMRRWVQEVVSDMWEGQGADAFVRCINEEALPFVQEIVESVTQINDNVHRAADIIEQADEQAARIAEDLADTFEAI